MNASRWERYALAAGAVLVILLIFAFAWIARPLFPPEWNAYVGQTREQVIRHWGQPDDEWDGSYGSPLARDAIQSQYGSTKTLRFDRFRGSLYVEVHEVDGRWV